MSSSSPLLASSPSPRVLKFKPSNLVNAASSHLSNYPVSSDYYYGDLGITYDNNMPAMEDSYSSRSPSPYHGHRRAERDSYGKGGSYPRSRSPRRRYSRSPDRGSRYQERRYRSRSWSRSRSRSPPPKRNGAGGEDRGRKSGGGGFRWKEKPRRDEEEDRKAERRLERGYRELDKSRTGNGEIGAKKRDDDVEAKFGPVIQVARRDVDAVGSAGDKAPGGGDGRQGDDGGEKKKPKEKKAKPVQPVDEMIIVNINDRLGTKAAIPCLASDPIRLFKAQVAARIGRQPHEIMLKRQGERPFKDQLTLEDYGVSNGVQLDLEIDTGD